MPWCQRKTDTVTEPQKALKALRGKEKLENLEERLAGFRQELTLHITVELRYNCSSLRLTLA